ncbi:MAG TPA: hypothetical protein VG963_31025 [Polyangiaceae bacterium]|nr:hypothetical protein [Polyangiaceae bacterium]
MSIERRRNRDLQAGMRRARLIHKLWQIALEMCAQRQKVRDHDDVLYAAPGEGRYGSCKIGSASFEKRGLDGMVAAALGKVRGDGAHGVIGGFDA